jgi:hypothetical protein
MKQILIFFSVFLLISCNKSNYEILNEKVSMNVSRINVKLNYKMTEDELKVIANDIRKSRKNYTKIWISFFRPDSISGKIFGNPWAMASFTPDLSVEILQKDTQSNPNIEFPKYASVAEMLEASGDYKKECVELISKGKEDIHVRVSSEFLNDEIEKNIKEQVKRDIIYVVFQTFAETEINNITVTSIPIMRSTFNPNVKYDGKLQEKYKETVTINRNRAIQILNKYLQTTNFKDLYKLGGSLYLPNARFELLKYDEKENVFVDLKKL